MLIGNYQAKTHRSRKFELNKFKSNYLIAIIVKIETIKLRIHKELHVNIQDFNSMVFCTSM